MIRDDSAHIRASDRDSGLVGANGKYAAGGDYTDREVGRQVDILYTDALTERMLAFVRDTLAPVDNMSKAGLRLPFRSRFAHTERVLAWVFRLAEVEGGDIGVLAAATIFHDVGYSVVRDGHAHRSADIFRSYIETERPGDTRATTAPGSEVRRAVSDPATVALIASVIAAHSDKHLPDGELTRETRLLMDADMLDEEGALSVLWDCFDEATSPGYGYVSAYNRLLKHHTEAAARHERFHTGEGRRRYLEMRALNMSFLDSLKTELNV